MYRPGNFNELPVVVKNLLIINGLLFLATISLSNLGYDEPNSIPHKEVSIPIRLRISAPPSMHSLACLRISSNGLLLLSPKPGLCVQKLQLKEQPSAILRNRFFKLNSL